MKNLIEMWQVLLGRRLFTSKQEALVHKIVSEAIDEQRKYDMQVRIERMFGVTPEKLEDFKRLKL